MSEFRVWCENGDLLGYATVERDTFTVVDADRNSGYYWFEGESVTFTYAEQARLYAWQWAEGYLAHLEETCACWDANDRYSGDCGVMSDHGYSIEYCD